MTLPSLHWFMNSDAGLFVRIAIGATFFASLALHDLLKRGSHATRWREYSFLLLAILLAMVYGTANDLITSQISWEYFYYGKGLWETLGPRVPPAPGALAWGAAKVGMQATWSAGALIGVAMLIANNPRKDRPQLPYRRMIALLLQMVLIVIPFAAAMGVAGYLGYLDWVSADLRGIVHDNLFRPRRFLCVFGIHTGAYIGGVAGLIWCMIRIARERQRVQSEDG